MTREIWAWKDENGVISKWTASEEEVCSVCYGLPGHPVQLVPIGDAAKYMKEGETVAECIERNRRDADAAAELLRKAQEQLEEAQKDAARYRWLRDGSNWPAVFASSYAPEPLRGEELDAAIAAKGKEQSA